MISTVKAWAGIGSSLLTSFDLAPLALVSWRGGENARRSRKSIGISSLACSEMWVKMRPEQGKQFGVDSQITWEFRGRLARLAPIRYLSRRALEGRLRVPQNPQHPPACCVCLRLGHRAMAQQTG